MENLLRKKHFFAALNRSVVPELLKRTIYQNKTKIIIKGKVIYI